MKTFTSYQKEFTTAAGNTSTTTGSTNSLDNLSWGMRMINDGIRELATIFYFNEVPYIIPGGTVANQQGYQLPADFEKIMNITVQVGGLLYQPKESPSKQHFDFLNVVPYYNDFPQFYYIFNGKVLLYPTPATSGNIATINYKKRVTDIAMDDVTDISSGKTVSVTTNTTTITASGAGVFKKWMGYNGWIQIPFGTTDASSGDGRWYKIASVTSDTVIELLNPYMGATVTGGKFTVGDVPILPEDYQNLPLYKTLKTYFTARVTNKVKSDLYSGLYTDGYKLLDDKYGSKTTSPVLTDEDYPVYNPNLFPRNLTQI